MHTNEKAKLHKRLKIPELATGAFVLNDKNEALLITGPKFRPVWTVPGGHVDRFETMAQCAKRELAEETGLRPKHFAFFRAGEDLNVRMHRRRRHFIFLDFAARVKGRPKLKLNHELTAWAWMTEKQIRASKGIRKSAKDAYLDLYKLLKTRKIRV